MATKHENSCLNNSADDEPLFVLCARDPDAPATVRDWAARAGVRGAPDRKVVGARAVAEEMERWQEANPDKVKKVQD